MSISLNIRRHAHHVRTVSIDDGTLSSSNDNSGSSCPDELEAKSTCGVVEDRPLTCSKGYGNVAL